jgi:hypothetical protein
VCYTFLQLLLEIFLAPINTGRVTLEMRAETRAGCPYERANFVRSFSIPWNGLLNWILANLRLRRVRS